LQGRGKTQKKRGCPISKGKEAKGSISKIGPSKDLIFVDGVEHQLEDHSLSSDKSEWEYVRKKRAHPVQGDGDEVLGELEGPPTKKVATAEAVAAALNVGFEVECKGMEMKTDSLMENEPQASIK